VTRKAADPSLYDADSDPPALLASQCARCQRIDFPAKTIGCPRCGAGAEHLAIRRLPATGAVYSLVVAGVNTPDPVAPPTIVDVALHEGPIVRALLADGQFVEIGDAVRASWRVREVDQAGDELVEPVFSAATGGARDRG
jgi:uncharacterized OB-fold protein